jgi:hypothetical protein
MAVTRLRNGTMSRRDLLENRYKNTRWNILIVAIATMINVILVTGDTYFLFSAIFPYTLVYLSAYFCGVYPIEYYEGVQIEFLSMSLFIVAMVIAIIAVGLYLLAFFLSSKRRVGWMIFALIMFILDTLFLLGFYGISLDMAIDYIFHIWVLGSLVIGIKSHFDLKKLPEEPELAVASVEETGAEAAAESADSRPLGMADMEVKSRIFLQVEANGYTITYRRVKKTNQLLINNHVYDEYEALVEQAHVLSATLGGHLYEVGTGSNSVMFIDVDGQRLAKKLRIF